MPRRVRAVMVPLRAVVQVWPRLVVPEKARPWPVRQVELEGRRT